MPVRVQALDHLVLRVADPGRSVAWYREHLGLSPVRLDEWERGEVLFPSVRVDEHTIIDFLAVGDAAPSAAAGHNVDHLCFVVDDVDLGSIAASGEFDDTSEPARLFGARGMGTSIYLRDPDGTLIELRTYP
jgi:catechol 2,3-dioxygenase-like lactoylglutathione lyase family enzyme